MDHEPAQMVRKDHSKEPTSGPLQRQDQPTVAEERVRVAADARTKGTNGESAERMKAKRPPMHRNADEVSVGILFYKKHMCQGFGFRK